MEAVGDFKPYGVVYLVEHEASGRVYVGQTTQCLSKRWADHIRTDYCVRLHRAIRKYGQENFTVTEIDRADSKGELDALEAFYIVLYGSTDRRKGFNLRDGGSTGKHSDASKQKMSEAVRKAYENPEFRKKLTAAKLGKKHTPERVAKVVAALTGKKATEEAKKSLSAARKKLWADPVARENMHRASVEARTRQDYKATVSKNTKNQWADPESRKKLLAAVAAGKAAFWADPEKRAARIAKRRATIAAKKLAAA